MKNFVSRYARVMLALVFAMILMGVVSPSIRVKATSTNAQISEAGLYDAAGTKVFALTRENVGAGYRNVKAFLEANPTTTKIVLPYGETHLNTYAFKDCTNLVSIFLPESVASIGLNVFEGCINLEEVSIPNNLVEIDNYAFKDCISLKEFDLQNRLTVGRYAFVNCRSLETVIGPNITVIGHDAFKDCVSLKMIDLSNVQAIGSRAFERCASLQSIDLPEAVDIGRCAFQGCKNLESVSAPKVTEIKNDTFANCYSLKSVHMPNVTEVGARAFENCDNLEEKEDQELQKENLFSFENADVEISNISKTKNPPTYIASTSREYGYKDVENGYFVYCASSSSSRYGITGALEEMLAPGSYKLSAEVCIPSGYTDKTKVSFGTLTLPSNPDQNYVYDIKAHDKWVKLEMAFIVKEGDTATYIAPAKSYLSAYPVYMRNVEVTEIVPKSAIDLRGYQWVTIGDSITQKSDASTLIYHDYIAFNTGVEVNNMSTGGAGYKALENKNAAYYQKALNIPAETDIITIMGSGTDLGDSTWKIGLGSPTDTGTDTICGCINTTIDNILASNPNAKLGIITPTPWSKYNQTTEGTEVGNRMNLYSEAIVAICEMRGIPYLDMYNNSGLQPWDEELAKIQFADLNTPKHPTEYGHSLIAPMIQEFIISLLNE